MAAIAFEPKPSRPPPRGTAGALGWLRAHLFYSWWSTLLMLRIPGQNPIWIGLYIEPFVFGGAVYFCLCFAMSKYSRVLERRGVSTEGA